MIECESGSSKKLDMTKPRPNLCLCLFWSLPGYICMYLFITANVSAKIQTIPCVLFVHLIHEMLHHTFKMLSFSNQSCTSTYPPRLMGLKVDFADNCFNFTTLSYGPQETQPFIWWYWAEEPLCRSKAVKAFRKIRYMRKRVRMECVGL